MFCVRLEYPTPARLLAQDIRRGYCMRFDLQNIDCRSLAIYVNEQKMLHMCTAGDQVGEQYGNTAIGIGFIVVLSRKTKKGGVSSSHVVG